MSGYYNCLRKFTTFNRPIKWYHFPYQLELFLVTNVRITSSAFRQIILRPTTYIVATHLYTRLEMRVDPWTVLQLHHASKRKNNYVLHHRVFQIGSLKIYQKVYRSKTHQFVSDSLLDISRNQMCDFHFYSH